MTAASSTQRQQSFVVHLQWISAQLSVCTTYVWKYLGWEKAASSTELVYFAVLQKGTYTHLQEWKRCSSAKLPWCFMGAMVRCHVLPACRYLSHLTFVCGLSLPNTQTDFEKMGEMQINQTLMQHCCLMSKVIPWAWGIPLTARNFPYPKATEHCKMMCSVQLFIKNQLLWWVFLVHSTKHWESMQRDCCGA